MSTEPGHLLVVDDNAVNRLIVGRHLELEGHTVSFDANGKEALQVLSREHIDLILLDIEMPGMDGFQVLATLVADPVLHRIPVVVISSLEDLASVVPCIEMGAEDYLHKPFNPVLLHARVNASLIKSANRLRAGRTGASYSGTANVAGQAYTPLGGGNGTIEYYVTARDNRGNSANSNPASVVIQYCPS